MTARPEPGYDPRSPNDDQVIAAPSELHRATSGVRDAMVDSTYASAYGCCVEAASALAWGLRRRGAEVRLVPGLHQGIAHLWCAVDVWILDPTRAQFGELDVVVRTSEAESYRPVNDARVPPLCEADLICVLASCLRGTGPFDQHRRLRGRSAIVFPVLEASGNSYLAPAVRSAARGDMDEGRCFCGEIAAAAWTSMGVRLPLCTTHLAPLACVT